MLCAKSLLRTKLLHHAFVPRQRVKSVANAYKDLSRTFFPRRQSVNHTQNAVKHLSTDFQGKPQQNEPMVVRVFEQGKTLPHQQWIIRMNNQNGYLSWCRNAYLCLSMSIALSMSPTFLAYINSGEVGSLGAELSYLLCGVAALSILNMIFGSFEFLYQSFKTRPLTQMSWVTLLIYTVFVIIHSLAFTDFAWTMIQCYHISEDDDVAAKSI